jgi:5S rRNA maturation endonuclease (ribonuclease M5)
MAFNFAEIPQFRNEFDELEEAVLQAKELGKSVIVPCPADKAGNSFRQQIRQAMKGRGIIVNTVIANDVIFVWYKAHVAEVAEDTPK